MKYDHRVIAYLLIYENYEAVLSGLSSSSRKKNEKCIVNIRNMYFMYLRKPFQFIESFEKIVLENE